MLPAATQRFASFLVWMVLQIHGMDWSKVESLIEIVLA